MNTTTAPAPTTAAEVLQQLAAVARHNFAVDVQHSAVELGEYDNGAGRRRNWETRTFADALMEAAMESLTLPRDPDTGHRIGCKLEALIPDDGGHNPQIREAVALVTGKTYSWPRHQGLDTEAIFGPREDAAFLRSQLRRWAVRAI